MNRGDALKAMIYGFAVGDALGVPVEFMSREKLTQNPVTGLREWGSHHQPLGTWSDDTSLTLALMDSLSSGLDFNDQATRFSNWLYGREYTPGGIVFDVGNTTRNAIGNFRNGHDPIVCGEMDEDSNGNGSLMRISPLAFYLQFEPEPERRRICFLASGLTHGHSRAKLACWFYVEILINLLGHSSPDKAVEEAWTRVDQWISTPGDRREWAYYQRCRSDIIALPLTEIRSSGYVVHSLEAALWCWLSSANYPQAVLKAVNLGNDTDTIGAITGSLSGLQWGLESVPVEWLKALRSSELIEDLCQKYIESW